MAQKTSAEPGDLKVERKRLVLDANILIRGCLGVRVNRLIAAYVDQVDFFVAEANLAEATFYIAELARKKGLDQQVCSETLLRLMRVVQMAEDSVLESVLDEALGRIRDPAEGLLDSFGRLALKALVRELHPANAGLTCWSVCC